MRAKSASNGANFAASLDLYGIPISAPGQYKLTFRSFIHCAYSGCENANDYILIQTREGGLQPLKDLIKIDLSKGRIRDEKWIYEEAYFTVNSVTGFFVNILF